MKLYILLIIFHLFIIDINAQDNADYTVHYDFKCISDTIENNYLGLMQYMLLRVGDQSTFVSSGRYYNDSTNMVFVKEHPQPTFRSQEEVQEYLKIYQSKKNVKPVGSDYKIFKDFQAGTFRIMPPVMTMPAHYMEEPMDFDWEITGKTDTILGLTCTQALTRYGGRNYEVWFSPEIPISDGPWTFQGLPGLILKVTDDRGWYTFTATRIITRKTNRYLKPDWINEFSKKVDRKAFVDHLTAYKQNPPKPLGALDFPEERMLAIKKAYKKRFDLLLEQY